MARAAGISATTVHKLWSANELRPHLTRTFKLSNDPQFEEKFWDVIGLYLAPSDKALGLCCDEKSEVQAWNVRSLGYLWGLVISKQNPMITLATARLRCSQRWIISRAN
jgi:hypothetical protein